VRYFFYFSIIAFISFSCSPKPSTECVLIDFESDAELDRVHWKCRTLFSLSNEHATHGTQSLRMELYPSDYPGFSPKSLVKDWSSHKTLSFDIFNTQDTDVTIIVRIDDQEENTLYTDRYNKKFKLKPGVNNISIPMDSLVTSGTRKPLNLENIYKLIIFMVRPGKKHVLYLDYMRIIK